MQFQTFASKPAGWLLAYSALRLLPAQMVLDMLHAQSISGLVVEYIVAIDVTRVRFPADAYLVHEYNLPFTCIP